MIFGLPPSARRKPWVFYPGSPASAQDGAKATIPHLASSEFGLACPGCPLDGPAAGTGPRADQAGSGPSVPRQSVRSRAGYARHRQHQDRSSGRGPPSQMQDSNDEVLTGSAVLVHRPGACYPGGVPATAVPAEPFYFIQTQRWCG